MGCLEDATLLALTRGELTALSRGAIHQHLDGCGHCSDVLAELLRDMSEGHCPPGAAVSGPGLEGRALGRYLVLERLGEGGMGEVYAAYDPKLDRKVALKLLREPAPVHGPGLAEGASSDRLLREARAMARLSHPNVVTAYDAHVVDGRLCLAVELVRGATLAAWLGARRERPEMLRVFVDAARGLQAAHDAGMVHGDFKPQNVLLSDEGRVQVTDFGLARLGTPAGAPAAVGPPGAIVGTPAYLSPEQRRGLEPDARSDQFSFFVALRQALTAGGARLPRWLARALERGLSVHPEDRFPTMAHVIDALQTQPARRRRRSLVAGAVCAVGALAGSMVGARALTRASLCNGAERWLGATWDPAQRSALEAAFLQSKAPYARASWAGVDAALSLYAARLAAGHREACEATRLRGERTEAQLASSMACLDRNRLALQALTGVLAQPNDEALREAVNAAAALPDVEGCLQPTRADSRARVPTEPNARKRLLALRPQLDHFRALVSTGQYGAAEKVAPALRAAATELGFKPFLGEVLLAIGGLQLEGSHLPEAEQALFEALRLAQAEGDDERAAAAAMQLFQVIAFGGDRQPEAQRWAGLAEASLERSGDFAADRIRLLQARWGLARTGSGFQQARQELLQALSLATRAGLLRTPSTAKTYRLLCKAEVELQLWQEAAGHGEQAVALYTELLGAAHPNVGTALRDLAMLEARRQKYDRARALLEQALSVYRQSLPPSHAQLVSAEQGLANVFSETEDFARAIPLMRSVLAKKEALFGKDSQLLAVSLNNLANVVGRSGDLKEAISLHARALELQRRALGEDSPELTVTLQGLGELELAFGRAEEALGHLKQAEALAQRYGVPRALPQILGLVGRAELARHRPREARLALERAYALSARADAPVLGDLAYIERLLSEALWSSGERARALQLARLAVEHAEARKLSSLIPEVRAWRDRIARSAPNRSAAAPD